MPITTAVAIQIVNANCLRIPWPVDAARERLRKQPVNAGPIQAVFPMKQATTKKMALRVVNLRSRRDEPDFIDQPPDQFEQYRTVADG